MSNPTKPLSPQASFSAAKRAKNDEFYTQLTDIEKELEHYRAHFKDKVVFCNCDDPEWSSFWTFFKLQFERLGLSKLVATHFADGTPSYKLEYFGRDKETVKTPLQGDGDFRSAECIEILKEADIVVTNPPFSLFRKYLAMLVEHGKKFLILGNNNALTYKETFELIQSNQLWMGYGVNKTMEFRLADSYERWSRVDKEGRKYGKVPAISWFTNLSHKKRTEQLTLFRKYTGNEGAYPRYDNSDVIEVSRVSNIPCDYEGAMGVPITFLDKFNPAQFEIIGNEYTMQIEKGRFYLAGRRLYSRLVIKRIAPNTGDPK